MRRFQNELTSKFLNAIHAMCAPDVVTPESSMVYGEQTKYVTWRVPGKFDSIDLMHLTDLQFGHVMCRYERVKEYRDWLLAEPNRFALFGGDMIDAWASHSPGSPFEQLGNAQNQVYKFCEVWAPARHRILGFVGGNHERRAQGAFGDLGTLLAMLLKIPYSAGRQFIDIHFGKHAPFKVTLWHGAGGARTKGTVAQILSRFMGEGDSQLYLMGHVHQPMVIPTWKEYRDPGKARIATRKAIGAVSSSFLETWNTYGEVAGYSASDVLMACAQIERSGHWQVTLR